jgi:hypothetical protein
MSQSTPREDPVAVAVGEILPAKLVRVDREARSPSSKVDEVETRRGAMGW